MGAPPKAPEKTQVNNAGLPIDAKIVIGAVVLAVLAFLFSFKAVKRFCRNKLENLWRRVRRRGEPAASAAAATTTNAQTPDIDLATQQDDVLAPRGPIPRAMIRGNGPMFGNRDLVRAWSVDAAFTDMPAEQPSPMFDVELQEGIEFNPWA